MAWYTTPVSNLLQWGANANQALGGDPTTARNLSSAIRDPNLNYTGGLGGIFDGKNNFMPASRPTGQVAREGKTPGPGEDNKGVLGAYGTGSGYDPAEVESVRFDLLNKENQYNSALGRLDSQMGTALGNIQGDYQSAYDRLVGSRDVARRDNQVAVDKQLTEYQSARDANNSNARNLLMGARRLLGSQGAGGGSADLFAAPLASQQEANNANAVVKQTNEFNLGALTRAKDDNEREYGNQFTGLAERRDQGLRDTRSQYETQRADILSGLGTLQGQRAMLNGQNYQQAMAAAAPYTSRVQGILAQIDSLAARPTGVREGAVNLARPDLAQYNLGRYDAPAVAQQDPSLGAATPYNTLVGMSDEQRRQLGY